MTFVPTTVEYLAAWLLPQAMDVTAVSPTDLREGLRELAARAHTRFAQAS